MKKINNKIIAFVLIIIIFFSATFEYVNASLGGRLDSSLYNQVTSEQDTELDGALSNVASTIMIILQVLAIAGVVITGIRYMYAGSEDKAKIKQTLIWIVVGAIFVFAASTIINFITDSGNSIF